MELGVILLFEQELSAQRLKLLIQVRNLFQILSWIYVRGKVLGVLVRDVFWVLGGKRHVMQLIFELLYLPFLLFLFFKDPSELADQNRHLVNKRVNLRLQKGLIARVGPIVAQIKRVDSKIHTFEKLLKVSIHSVGVITIKLGVKLHTIYK